MHRSCRKNLEKIGEHDTNELMTKLRVERMAHGGVTKRGYAGLRAATCLNGSTRPKLLIEELVPALEK